MNPEFNLVRPIDLSDDGHNVRINLGDLTELTASIPPAFI